MGDLNETLAEAAHGVFAGGRHAGGPRAPSEGPIKLNRDAHRFVARENKLEVHGKQCANQLVVTTGTKRPTEVVLQCPTEVFPSGLEWSELGGEHSHWLNGVADTSFWKTGGGKPTVELDYDAITRGPGVVGKDGYFPNGLSGSQGIDASGSDHIPLLLRMS